MIRARAPWQVFALTIVLLSIACVAAYAHAATCVQFNGREICDTPDSNGIGSGDEVPSSAAPVSLPATIGSGCHPATALEQWDFNYVGAAIPGGEVCQQDLVKVTGGCPELPYPYLFTKYRPGAQSAKGGADGIIKLNAEFACRLYKFFKASDAASQNITIVSGYRSNDTQEVLWQAALTKYGDAADARKWVAPPGNSMHNKGLAVDLGFPSGNAGRDWAHNNVGTFNLTFRLSNEPWHVEPSTAPAGYTTPLPSTTVATGEDGATSPQSGSPLSQSQLPTGQQQRIIGVSNVQTCTFQSTGFNGTPVYLCNTTAASSGGGLFGGGSGNLMGGLAGMQLGNGLGSSLFSPTASQPSIAQSPAPPAPLPPLPPPAPLPAIPTQGGSSSIDALLAALQNPSSATTSFLPPPPPPPGPSTAGPIVNPPGSPPSALSATPSSGAAPLAVLFSFPANTAATSTFMLDFGDGATATTNAACPASSAGACSGSVTHTYATARTYIASLFSASGGAIASTTIFVAPPGAFAPGSPATVSSGPVSFATSSVLDVLTALKNTVASLMQTLASLFGGATTTTP